MSYTCVRPLSFLPMRNVDLIPFPATDTPFLLPLFSCTVAAGARDLKEIANRIGTTWGTYRTSVDAIETATDLDLVSAVPAAIQQTIEARTDNGPTS